ncbi:MAG: tRNA-dihydrouridine synthase family protein [Bacilli bacterium]|nr:tRNA-dihydrouridine synthase family protein [Bacilli bacterium]
MFKIGNLEINGKIVLAPMAGYTSEGYRKFMNSFGCSLCFTEMVSDMGIIYDNEETNTYVRYQKDVCPTGVQLFGNNPEFLAKAAKRCLEINPNIEFFDVNMGCPVNKVIKPGSGSAVMRNPKLAGDIVRAIKEATNLPCTAKIRLGFDEVNFLEIIKELENGGVDAISIHPRTRKEFYMGEPHYDLVKGLRNKMNVPLIISGNIFTVEDALNALEITGADAVMIARGGLGNPLLIKDLKDHFDGKENQRSYEFDVQKKYCIELAKFMIEEKGETIGMRVYRSIAPKFFQGFPNSKSLRVKLASQLTTFDSLVGILNEFENDNMGIN